MSFQNCSKCQVTLIFNKVPVQMDWPSAFPLPALGLTRQLQLSLDSHTLTLLQWQPLFYQHWWVCKLLLSLPESENMI